MRLYLNVMLPRRQVQWSLRIVELIHRACVRAVDDHASVARRDREAHTTVPLTRNESQRSDRIGPVVPRVIERIAERVSKEDTEANAKARTELEPRSKPAAETVVIESARIESAVIDTVMATEFRTTRVPRATGVAVFAAATAVAGRGFNWRRGEQRRGKQRTCKNRIVGFHNSSLHESRRVGTPSVIIFVGGGELPHT